MSIEGESFPAGSRDPQLLLSAMQRISHEQLGGALDRVLRRTDDYLFDSTSSGGGELTALRDLRRARAQLQQRFEQALAAGFRRLQEAPMPGKAMDASSLSLVSDEALEEQLASEQAVDNLTKAFAPGLEVLEKRLAALTERPVLQARDNPSGPKFIAESMSNAMAALEVSTNIRIIVYTFLERELATVLGPLYERLNAGLAAAGLGHQADAFVIADHLGADAGVTTGLTDIHGCTS